MADRCEPIGLGANRSWPATISRTAWKENRSPSIEAYLLQLPQEHRDTIFRELLTVELTLTASAAATSPPASE